MRIRKSTCYGKEVNSKSRFCQKNKAKSRFLGLLQELSRSTHKQTKSLKNMIYRFPSGFCSIWWPSLSRVLVKRFTPRAAFVRKTKQNQGFFVGLLQDLSRGSEQTQEAFRSVRRP